MNAASAHLQLQAQLTIPLTATVTTVSLTATGSATGLVTAPAATAPVAVVAAGSPVGAGTLPVGTGTLPAGLTSPNSTLSPTGGADVLLPTLAPTAPPTSIPAGTRQVASKSDLPSGSTHVGVELLGLIALAAAFLLAVTRVSIRRPPGTTGKGGGGKGTAVLPPVPGAQDGPPAGGTDGAE